MKTNFKNILMRKMIERLDFMPLKDNEGNLKLTGAINILAKNSYGTNIIVELLDGDKFTSEEIVERLQANKRILSELKGVSAHFFEVFIFDHKPEKDKLDAVISGQFQKELGKKYLKCISVDLSIGSAKKHFKVPMSDMGLIKIIGEVIAGGVSKEEDIINEIEDLALHKEQQNEIEIETKTPILTITLIVINIIVAALLFLLSGKSGISYNQLLVEFGAKENSLIMAGEYWRFMTPIFLHASIQHLLINCYSLYVIGVTIENFFGRLRFFVIFLISGVLGNVASFMFSLNPGVGASGAIFGLLGTLLYFGLQRPALFKRYFGYNVLITIVINLAYGFSRAGIDNYAHIGGLIGGFLTSGIVLRSEKPHWYLNRYLYLVLTIALAFSGVFYGFHNEQNYIVGQVTELIELDQAQKWDQAEEKGEQILKLKPGNKNIEASVLWSVAKAEDLTGKYQEAVEHAKMLKQIDPLNGHYILGVIYFDMQEFELSKTELLEAKKAGANVEQIDKLLDEINKN